MERYIDEGIKVFGLSSDSEAADYFKMLNKVKAEIREQENFKFSEIAKIEKWFEEEIAPLNKKLEHYQGELTAYFLHKRREDPKAKLSTPWGKVTARKIKKWAYQEDVVMEYMKANNPDMIRTKLELDKASIKKVFKDGVDIFTGEVVPGIEITEEESISVKGDE